MDRHSKMAEIKLVSKYYPVGNYSYPRNEDGSVPTSQNSPTIARRDRCSVGSESSAPGLIDDRADSEVSHEDDDYSQAGELWNSFWRPGGEWRLEDATHEVDLLFSAKESSDGYAALIPCPQHRRVPSQKSAVVDENTPAWPLPKPHAECGTSVRKPVAKYSAFPSVKARPQRSSPVTSPLSPRSPNLPSMPAVPKITTANSCAGPPPRPDRPAALLTPCLQQPGKIPASIPNKSTVLPPRNDSRRPKTSSGAPPRRGSKLTDVRFQDDANIFGIHAAASRSSENLAKMSSTATSRTSQDACQPPRHFKSTTYLGAARLQQQQQQQLAMAQSQPEPHSVFEEDSDCEESTGLSFFRFHKRSSSEKSYKGSSGGQEALNRKRRNRADTSPVSFPTKPAAEKERRVDVFGRMLGRRSR